MQRLWFTSFFSLLLGTGVLFGQGTTALNPAAAARARERGMKAQAASNQSDPSQTNPQPSQPAPGARISQPPVTPQGQPAGTPPVGAGNPAVPGAGPFAVAAPTPQAPPTPAELPPVPPQVTYRDGLLTVNAPNSSLSTVISAIRAKTGIEFEGIDSMVPDRLALSIGPAPESEVLAAIFDGSRFDYVVVGRTDSPNIVQRVVLTPKQGAPPPAGGAVAMRPQQRPPAGEGDDEDTPDEQVSNGDPEPQDIPNQPPVPQQAQQPQNPQPQQQQQGPAKSPEQLLQELRQMQQQQQQKDPGSTAQPNPNVPRKPPI